MNTYPMSFLNTAEYDEAEVVVLGVPLDKTTCFKPGTRFGPRRIRDVFFGLEDYSPMNKRYYSSLKVHDMGDVVINDLQSSLNETERIVEKIYGDGKKVIGLGGEHTITLPIVKSVSKFYDDLVVLHLDAHFDMAEEYEGQKISHACVMRRITELGINVIHYGIRSGDKEEWEIAKTLSFDELKGALEGLSHVYVSLDIDVLDPSFAPGTGTPEPGGLSYNELVEALRLAKNVVGLDIVEVSPPLDCNDITSITAARILRDFSLYYFG